MTTIGFFEEMTMSDDPKCTVCGAGGNAYLRCQYAGCPDGRDLPTLRPTDAARAEIARLTAERDAEREARERLEAALRDIGGVGYAHPKDAKTFHDEAVDRARAALGGSA
jgi:hypothetical protein